MSLRVWLPLNGTLDNQGLSSVTVTNNGATVDNNGKIGKCYYFTPNQWMKISIPVEMTTIKNTTIAVWVKSHSTSMAVGGISHDGAATLAGITLYSSGWQFSGAGNWKYVSCGTITNTQVWHHAVCTVGEDAIITYLDGVKVTSSTLTAQGVTNTNITSDNFIEIGCDHPGGDEYFTGYINDFRIYDHCLSPKEVKELSKGLVLHYKLDGKDESTTNLRADGYLDTSQAYNQMNNAYGYGSNTDIYYEIGEFQGRNCMKVKMGTAGQSAYPYVNTGSNGPLANSYRTLSFDYYPTIMDTLQFYTYKATSPCSYKWKVDNLTGNSDTPVTSFSIPVVINKWNHIEVTLYNANTSNAEGWPWIRIGNTSHTSTTTDYWLFSNVQVENKDHATPFTLGTRTYTTEYDCSGYGHNGTIVGNITASSDTPRYNNCIIFNSNTSYIVSPEIPYSNFSNSYTFSWWQKMPTWDSCMLAWGFKNGNKLNVSQQPSKGIAHNTADGFNNPYLNNGNNIPASIYQNGWHFMTLTGNGTNAILYIDGILAGIATTYKGLTGTQVYISGWNTQTEYKWKDGQMSDFRIYATALSADDILELYHTSASIGNDGTVYAYELEEV